MKSISLKITLLVFLTYLLGSCVKKESLPNKLPGRWTDDNQRVTFYENFDYGIRYLRTGTKGDTVLVDSLWGYYVLDNPRNNVTFYQKGFKTKSAVIVKEFLKTTTWNVKFQSDTVFKYESSTTVGFMKRANK